MTATQQDSGPPGSAREGSPRRFWLLAAALGAAIGVFALGGFGGGDGAPDVAPEVPDEASSQALSQTAPTAEPASAPMVETLLSEARPYPLILTLRGATEAARNVEVSAQTAGLVASPPRRKGERISAGEVLCEIEPGERPARLAEAKARLVEADAVAKASAELGKKGFSAETTRARDQAALEAAKAAVSAIELDLKRTRITAPFDGWLESDSAELGALLSVGSPCARLLALDPIAFVGFAAEGDVGAITKGAPARALLADGREINAQVSFIARSADAKTRTFRVEASAPNPAGDDGEPLVRDGASVTLLIGVGERQAHKAPRASLMLDDEGRLGVMLAEDGLARFQAVEVLADSGDGVWLAGPPERAEIVVTGQYYLSDGAPVRTAPMATPGPTGPPPEPAR